MVTSKAGRDNFHLIGPGDRISIWWPSAAQHVWVTVLAVELETTKRWDGSHFVTGAWFAIYNANSHVYEKDGSQTQVKRVATLHASAYFDDVENAYTPEEPQLTADQHATLLAHLREHGGPESNAVYLGEL